MTTILWKRVDGTGFDRATVEADGSGARIAGTALFSHDAASYDIRYSVIVDAGWNTRIVAAHVQGPGGERRLSLRVDETGNWTVGGEVIPGLSGAHDVDLAFTPAANTLPIRRLGLEVGQGADFDVAYVAFPDRAVRLEPQRYERITHDVYRYTAAGGSFDLTVQADGFVADFPGHWAAIETA